MREGSEAFLRATSDLETHGGAERIKEALLVGQSVDPSAARERDPVSPGALDVNLPAVPSGSLWWFVEAHGAGLKLSDVLR